MAQVSEAVGMIWLRKMLDQALLGNRSNRISKSSDGLELGHLVAFNYQSKKMLRSQRVLAVLVLLSYAGDVISMFQKAPTRQSRLPRAPSLAQQRNLTALPSLLKYAAYSPSIQGTLLIHSPGRQVCTIPLLILGSTVSSHHSSSRASY